MDTCWLMWKPAVVSWGSGRRVAHYSSSQGKGWHMGSRAGVSHKYSRSSSSKFLLPSQSPVLAAPQTTLWEVSCPPRGRRPTPRWWSLSRDSVPSSATSAWSSPSPAVCPLTHEHRWWQHLLLSEGQTETSVEQTKTSLLIPTLSYFLLLEARLFYFREH